MSFAFVSGGAIVSEMAELPLAALISGSWLSGLDKAPVLVQESAGYFVVADAGGPANTPTQTSTRSLVLTLGRPTAEYTVRNWTVAELAAMAKRTADTTKKTNLENSIATLRSWSITAQGITVTNGNATAVLNGVVDNLAIFYDRFADFLEIRL